MSKKLSIISRISLACFTAYFSVVMCLGLVGGYFLGRFISRKIFKGRSRPLILQIKSVKIHLHHWIFGVLWLVCLKFFAEALMGNLLMTGLGIGSGVIFEDIWHDRKWFKIFGRVR